MLKCTNCQAESLDDARFCDGCGAELTPTGGATVEDAPLTRAVTKPTCPSCGTNAPTDAEFCPKCGRAMRGYAYAGFWKRWGSNLLDSVIALVIGGVSGGIFSLLLPGVTGSAVYLLVVVGYYVILNGTGGTWGKRIVGLRLQDARTGEDIGYYRAFVRYIVAIVSAIVLFLGYFWVLWDEKKQTWHDKAAGSVVVVQ
ncbi:MAG: RDD family protein [Planctomycetes bacterium]|nr:RDD family protein [Planctomycetota bacterium]